jgi:hypothetical protein
MFAISCVSDYGGNAIRTAEWRLVCGYIAFREIHSKGKELDECV